MKSIEHDGKAVEGELITADEWDESQIKKNSPVEAALAARDEADRVTAAARQGMDQQAMAEQILAQQQADRMQQEGYQQGQESAGLGIFGGGILGGLFK